jgi:hypothetical protein
LAYAIGTHGLGVLINLLVGCACLAREGIAFQSISAMDPVLQGPVRSLKKDCG